MSRKLLMIILVLAVLLLGGYLFLRFSLQSAIKKDKNNSVAATEVDSLGGKKVSGLDLRPLFIERMQQLVNKSSNGLYDLSVGDMQMDVLASTLTFSDVMMKIDSAKLDSLKNANDLPGDIYTASLKQLQIEGINLDDAITSKTMDYKLVKLVKPEIIIHHRRKSSKKEDEVKEEFSHRFLKEMEKLSVGKLVIEDGEITVYDAAKKTATNKLKNVSVELNDILVDSSSRNEKERFLFAKEGRLSFKDFEKPTPDGLYKLKIGEVLVTSPQPQVTLTNFSFTSPLSKQEFVNRQKQSKELYNLTLPSVTMKGIDWWNLLNEEEIIADEISTGSGKLSIYLDRSLPPKNKMGNFPNQLIMKLPVKLNVDRMNLNNLDFSYSEYNPISKQEGTVYIDKVDLNIKNVSNFASNKTPMTVNGSALFMRKIPIKADFVFDMANYKSGRFSIAIKSEGFDGSVVNSFSMPMGLVKIENGNLQGVETTINGDQLKANSDVKVLYKDLKLHLLEKDKGEQELDKKGFTTFFANLFVLKKDNPKANQPSRTEKATFNRIKEGGFFMLIWKTLLVGVLKTIGAPEKLASKTIATTKKKQ